MREFIVQRVATGIKGDATPGILMEVGRGPFAVTLEPPDLGNLKDQSSIPAKSYLADRFWSGKFQREVFKLRGVVGRTDILLHPGSLRTDTIGCVIVGEKFYDFGGEWGIAESQTAPHAGFNEFMDRCRGEQIIMVHIRKPNPGG